MAGRTKIALNLEILCRCFSLVRDFLVFDNLPLVEAAEPMPRNTFGALVNWMSS
jgi:hypothetical protein